MCSCGSCPSPPPRSSLSSCLNLGLASSPNLRLRTAGYRPKTKHQTPMPSLRWSTQMFLKRQLHLFRTSSPYQDIALRFQEVSRRSSGHIFYLFFNLLLKSGRSLCCSSAEGQPNAPIPGRGAQGHSSGDENCLPSDGAAWGEESDDSLTGGAKGESCLDSQRTWNKRLRLTLV